MKREEILINIKKYFDVRELVGEEVYQAHSDRAWQFLDTNLLHCLLLIREGIGKPITVNTWMNGGSLSQRGLRSNVQSIVKDRTAKNKLYLSAHCMGKAVDFDVKGMTADEVRTWIIWNNPQFPCPIRLEQIDTKTGRSITWVHLDVFPNDDNQDIYIFDV